MSRRWRRGASDAEQVSDSIGMSGDYRTGAAYVVRQAQAPGKLWHAGPSSGIGRLLSREVVVRSAQQAAELAQLNVVPKGKPTLLYYGAKTLNDYGLRGGEAALARLKESGAYNAEISEGELVAALGAFGFLHSKNKVLRTIYLPRQLLEGEFIPLSRTVIGDSDDAYSYYQRSGLREYAGALRVEVGYIHGSDQTPESKARTRDSLRGWQGWTSDPVTLGPLQVISRANPPYSAAPPQGAAHEL